MKVLNSNCRTLTSACSRISKPLRALLTADAGRWPSMTLQRTRKAAQLEKKLSEHDEQVIVLVEAINQLMNPNVPPKTRRIGFTADRPGLDQYSAWR